MNSLLANISKREGGCNTHHQVTPIFLIKTRHDERQALDFLLPIRVRGHGDLLARGVDEPEREPREDARMREELEVWPLRDDDDAVPAHRADVALVDDGGALSDDGSV